MKLKAALVLMLLVLTSLLSFSNRCGSKCDGRTMVLTTAVASAATTPMVNAICPLADEKRDGEVELAEASPLLRMTIIL
jgi:hypothetical protein